MHNHIFGRCQVLVDNNTRVHFWALDLTPVGEQLPRFCRFYPNLCECLYFSATVITELCGFPVQLLANNSHPRWTRVADITSTIGFWVSIKCLQDVCPGNYRQHNKGNFCSAHVPHSGSTRHFTDKIRLATHTHTHVGGWGMTVKRTASPDLTDIHKWLKRKMHLCAQLQRLICFELFPFHDAGTLKEAM